MELRHIIASRLHLLHRGNCPWTAESPPNRAYLGEYGELAAASWLRSQGYKVLRRRFRLEPGSEVDLVCRQGDTLVFTEVKSTTCPGGIPPARRVNWHKRQLLRQGARNWLMLLQRRPPLRFDVVEVMLVGGQPPRFRLHERAFPLHGEEKRPGGALAGGSLQGGR